MTKEFKEVISQLEKLELKVRLYSEGGRGLLRKKWESKGDFKNIGAALKFIKNSLGENTTDMSYERDFTVKINKKKFGEVYIFYDYKGTGYNKGPVYQNGSVAYKLEAVLT